ncbi:hypothetical protein AAZX31_20G144400 [Glycine max]|uniref:Uncharacterized protein n=1 Tax=Glycine max TaxID=3847 RepID=I1NGR8_SOYBN|nr:uncharacterized protein LOC100787230 isoform X2 [Glycine max]KAG4907885.1 hypothetical protein JHK86_056369 [Glycine max]KAG4919093.1 hypothetical protein JHK85_057374 [Glycine max]KAG5075178.1 hypothetical protein JHK84_056409 [Glycine max]KAH1191127.1 hypothetical protein GmHk_20G058499 [Glycine max]|eukprot:XP_003556096.1 uncharacterized protein LOC100787230 isoform X1 [Glycine max]
MASTHKAMESTHDPETTSIWTDEKHRHYLNTMEASFVRTMLHHYVVVSPQPLRLDRYLPDTSESTLDSRTKKHAPADSVGRSRGRRRKRRSSKNQVQNSSAVEEQGVSDLENGRESVACGEGGDDKEPIEN